MRRREVITLLSGVAQNVPVLDRDGRPTGEYRYEGQVANKALELLGKKSVCLSIARPTFPHFTQFRMSL
jgi:hypothetical protein